MVRLTQEYTNTQQLSTSSETQPPVDIEGYENEIEYEIINLSNEEQKFQNNIEENDTNLRFSALSETSPHQEIIQNNELNSHKIIKFSLQELQNNSQALYDENEFNHSYDEEHSISQDEVDPDRESSEMIDQYTTQIEFLFEETLQNQYGRDDNKKEVIQEELEEEQEDFEEVGEEYFEGIKIIKNSNLSSVEKEEFLNGYKQNLSVAYFVDKIQYDPKSPETFGSFLSICTEKQVKIDKLLPEMIHLLKKKLPLTQIIIIEDFIQKCSDLKKQLEENHVQVFLNLDYEELQIEEE